ncbi:MAG: hypothetical protein HONBIEJF_02662 [Fimbriimonadaceae bacterium]|nr:hypothetical protein [Fimbriimonadaceae bacterium]
MANVSDTFWQAISDGDLDAVRRHLDDDPSLISARTPSGALPAQHAYYYGHPEIAKHLASQMQEFDLHTAVVVGDWGTALQHLTVNPEAIESLSQDGGTPLGFASYFGHQEIAEKLVEQGADLEARSPGFGNVTPLHAAAAGRCVEVVRLLLTRGADPNARQEGGFTALHSAAQNGDITIIEMLIAAGADPSATTDDGKTAADVAREAGHDYPG